jgi:HCOMODA/2-hydroxy-3-carboxy-muconic semialdehyde decarboxylase
VKTKLSASRELVDDLVAASRILAMHEVLDAYGHVSARSDRKPERFVMSRSLAPALVTAPDLMELDADSEPLPGDSRKGFIERYIHGEIYRTRPDVMAVVHSIRPR